MSLKTISPVNWKVLCQSVGWKYHLCAVFPVGNFRFNSSAVSASVDVKNDTASNSKEYANAKPFNSIPGPKGLPLVGSWLDYKRNPWKIHQRHIYIQQLKEEYGDIVKESFAGNTILHLFGPEYIRKVYETEGKHPYVPPLLPAVKYYRKSKEMSPGLGNCNGEEWYSLRRVARQILVRPQKALEYLYLQNAVADDFVSLMPSIIQENGEIDNFNQWLLRWGLESSFNVFLEKRMGYFDPSNHALVDDIIYKSDQVFELSTKLWFSLPFYKYFPTPSFNQLYACEDFLASYNVETLQTAVNEYRDQMEGRSTTDKQYLYLSYMLSNKNISWKGVVSISFSVLNDTLNTTVKALMFSLYSLATNPDAQENAYQEALETLTPSGELTPRGFNSCSYIKACMKESFRFFPIGLDVQRLAPSELVIGGYQIPEGTYISLENYVPLHDPNYIPNPDKFYPERWLRGNTTAKEKEHPYILIPFSVGTRMCAGRRFAEQEMVLMIAKILKNYKLEWHHKPLDQRFVITQVPDGELKLKFVPRKV